MNTTILLAAIQLFILIFKTFFSEKAKAEEAGKAFKLDQERLAAIMDSAIIKFKLDLAKESRAARDMDDRMEEDLKNGTLPKK